MSLGTAEAAGPGGGRWVGSERQLQTHWRRRACLAVDRQCGAMGLFDLVITSGVQWLENTPGQWGGKEGPGPPDGDRGRDFYVYEVELRILVSSTPA